MFGANAGYIGAILLLWKRERELWRWGNEGSWFGGFVFRASVGCMPTVLEVRSKFRGTVRRSGIVLVRGVKQMLCTEASGCEVRWGCSSGAVYVQNR